MLVASTLIIKISSALLVTTRSSTFGILSVLCLCRQVFRVCHVAFSSDFATIVSFLHQVQRTVCLQLRQRRKLLSENATRKKNAILQKIISPVLILSPAVVVINIVVVVVVFILIVIVIVVVGVFLTILLRPHVILVMNVIKTIVIIVVVGVVLPPPPAIKPLIKPRTSLP